MSIFKNDIYEKPQFIKPKTRRIPIGNNFSEEINLKLILDQE
jgi:hypothetical protein